MFKKLFGRKEAPTNEGKSGASAKVEGASWVKKFVLQLTNMEGSPTYNLTHQLSVGSEVGNIVIADPSVSPRHCTFVLQDNVVSVLDHGSIGGTFINGQKIPPGRYIILEETDAIRLGDLEIKINVKIEAAKSGIPEEYLVGDNSEEQIKVKENMKEEKLETIGVASKEAKKPAKPWFQFKQEQKNKQLKNSKKKAVALTGNSTDATNSIIRVLAVICDFLIAYSLYIVFSPFDEFRAFVSDVPVLIGSLLDVDWNVLWTTVNKDYAFVGEMLTDFYNFLTEAFNIGPLFLLFIILRLVTTLLFGVSISEGILGVKSHGNGFWKRVGGVLRVIIGVVTGPLLIFDIPAIISKRTLKEFITFTHTYVSSKFITILAMIFYLPLLLSTALLAPLLQGLELPEPIAINDKLDMRVKVVRPAEAAVEVVQTKDVSKFLNLEIGYDNQNIALIPSFTFSGQNKKLNYKPILVVYHRELKRSVEIEVLKTFDLKKLLGIGFKGDFLLKEKFPQIESYVYSSELANPAFKAVSDEKANQKFANEVVAFTKVSFELEASNAFDFMQLYTPFLKGVMDYRSSLLELIEYKEFDQIDFLKIGNAYFLRFTFFRQKPFDLLIPLIKGDGRVFKVEFDKKENLGVLKNKFYKFSLEDANWFVPLTARVEGETLKPLEVLDLFSRLDIKDKGITSANAQSLYGYYYEKSAEILKKDDPTEYELWSKSVKSIFAIMNVMKDLALKPVAVTSAPAEETPVPEDPRMKLFQNFQDLNEAIENKNKQYFGIEESVSI